MSRKPPTPLTMPELEKAKTLYALGKSYHAIGVELGRDSKTIKKWLNEPETKKEIEVLKEEVADLYDDLAQRILESITDETINEAKLRDRVISAGVCTDKSRLLKGLSTGHILLYSVHQQVINELFPSQKTIEAEVEE